MYVQRNNDTTQPLREEQMMASDYMPRIKRDGSSNPPRYFVYCPRCKQETDPVHYNDYGSCNRCDGTLIASQAVEIEETA